MSTESKISIGRIYFYLLTTLIVIMSAPVGAETGKRVHSGVICDVKTTSINGTFWELPMSMVIVQFCDGQSFVSEFRAGDSMVFPIVGLRYVVYSKKIPLLRRRQYGSVVYYTFEREH